MLSLKKHERKSALLKKIREQVAIYWKIIRAVPIQPARMVAMVHKSITAFHLIPAILSWDISRDDVVNLYNRVLKSFFGIPRSYNSLLLNTLLPIESPFSWTFRIAQKAALKLRCNTPEIDIATGMGEIHNERLTHFQAFLTPWENKTTTDRFGNVSSYLQAIDSKNAWMIWGRQGRLFMLYATSNIFPWEIGTEQKIAICKWKKLFTRKHRLHWKWFPIKRFRIYSVDYFKCFFTKAGYFNSAKYHTQIKQIQDEIWKLPLLPWNEENKKLAEEQDIAENFPRFIIDRLVKPKYRNIYFKFSEACNAFQNTNTEIKIDQIETGREWAPFANTVVRMETLVNPVLAEE